MTPGEPADPYRTVAQLVSGQRFLQRYSLKRILGRGGFGVVWLAHDEDLEMDVAIKFLSDMIVSNPEAIDDLKRETRYSLRLTHPNIVRIYGFLQSPDLAGVSMEYVDGGTLSALKIERPHRCFDVDDLAPIVAKLCDALHYAHTRVKVAHRDLKPGNLMVDSSGDLKVADFGISRSISDTQTALTRTAASGTPAYMSPQQMMGERSQVTDDIYSLGATLYDLLAGKPPFYQGNVVEQVRESLPSSIEARRADLGISGGPIPPQWEAVIRACLEKRAEDRPQSAAEVAERLGLPVNAQWRDTTPLGTPRAGGETGYSTPTSGGTPPDNRIVTPPGKIAPPDNQTALSPDSWSALPGDSRRAWPADVKSPQDGAPASHGVERSRGDSTSTVALDRDRPGALSPSEGRSARTGNSARNAFLAGLAVAVLAVAGFFAWRIFSGESASIGNGPESDIAQRQSVEPMGSEAKGQPEAQPSDQEHVESGEMPSSGAQNSADADSKKQSPPGGNTSEQAQSDGRTADSNRPTGAQTTGAHQQVENSSGSGLADLESEDAGARGPQGAAPPGEPRFPSSTEIVRALEAAIARQDWQGADRQLALLAPGAEAEDLARRVAEGRRAAEAESRLPRLIEMGDFASAETELQAFERIHPQDARAARWREQIDQMKASREGLSRERAEIRALVAEFHESFADLDLDRFAALFVDPGATRNEYERAFRDLASQTIKIVQEPSIELGQNGATVRLRDQRRQVMKIGRAFESEFDVVLHLEKLGDGWKIRTAETKLRQ